MELDGPQTADRTPRMQIRAFDRLITWRAKTGLGCYGTVRRRLCMTTRRATHHLVLGGAAFDDSCPEGARFLTEAPAGDGPEQARCERVCHETARSVIEMQVN